MGKRAEFDFTGFLDRLNQRKGRRPPPKPRTSPPVTMTPAFTVTPLVRSEPDPLPKTPPVMVTPAPVKAGYLWLPHEIMDNLLPTLTTSEQVVYLHLYRLSFGHHKDTCIIGLPRLSERTGLSLSQVRRVTRVLEKKGHVKRLPDENIALVRGAVFKVFAPPVTMTPPVTMKGNKEKLLKDTIKANCSRCSGTGFYYPEGIGNGPVKKCDHR